MVFSNSFVPRPIEGNFDDWLADSKPACNSAVSGRGILEGRGVDEDSDGGAGCVPTPEYSTGVGSATVRAPNQTPDKKATQETLVR